MQPPHIVLIEDNPADVMLVKRALKEKGIAYTLALFESGNQAVELLCAAGANDPAPDAILLDLNTPGTDGFSALLKLRAAPRLAGVPMAIITSSRARSDQQRAALYGARYIQKPSQLSEFLVSVGQALKEMLERGDSGSRAAPG